MTFSMRRVGAVTTAVAVTALTFAAPAAAHVHAEGDSVPQGGYGIVTLIVPSESDAAATTGVTITLPEGVDLTSARTLPIAGWTATVERTQSGGTERVSKILWTANDPAAGYGAAEYREFAFSAGPWPEGVESVALPSDQSYSDGSIVSWDEVAVDAASEPEHPAPEVTLIEAEEGHGDSHGGSAAEASTDHHEAAASTSDSSNTVWQVVSIVSLVLAVVAVAGLGVVLRRGRGTGS